MTDHRSAAISDETSKFCSPSDDSNTLIDEMPSLDALSFDREHCPSQNCLCHNKKHLQNNSNTSGLSAFGVRSSGTPLLVQNPTANSHSRTLEKDLPSGVPVVGSGFRFEHADVGRSSTDAVSAESVCGRVFGSGNRDHNVGGMQSFSQLCSASRSDTTKSATASPSLMFGQGHRGGQLPIDPTHSSQDIDLSDLQLVLPTTSEESQPVPNCPVHRHACTMERIPACTCGQQASRLDDCSYDELAAYFDNFCYIPKNMSPMAEMMYM